MCDGRRENTQKITWNCKEVAFLFCKFFLRDAVGKEENLQKAQDQRCLIVALAFQELVYLLKKNRLHTQRSIVRRRNTLQRLKWSDGVEIQGKYSKNHQDKNKNRERVR